MYEKGQAFGKLILIIFPIVSIILLGVNHKNRFPIIALFIVGWMMYVIPMELRPYFKEYRIVIFWLGILPNFGCAFALPILGLRKKTITYNEAGHKLLISSFISFGIILAAEILQLMKGFGTFDWLDIIMSILGTITVNVIFNAYQEFSMAFVAE